MAENSGPWSTGAGLSVDQWSQMFATFFGGPGAQLFGVNGDPNSSDLKPFGDSSGMLVKLPVGMAIVNGAWYYNDAQLSITIAANASGQTRIDTICLRRSTGTSAVNAIVVQGTPAASPAPPTLTSQDIRLADVTVTNGAVTIASGQVVDKRSYVPRGLKVCTHATRPAVASAGQLILETDTGLMYQWTGAATWQLIPTGDSGWQDFVFSATGWQDYAQHNGDAGSYHNSGYRKVGNHVFLRGLIQRNAAGGASSSNLVQLPTGYRPDSTNRFVVRTTVGNITVQVYVQVDGTVNIITDATLATNDAFPICTSFLTA